MYRKLSNQRNDLELCCQYRSIPVGILTTRNTSCCSLPEGSKSIVVAGVCEDATFPGKPFFYDGDVVKAAPGTKLTVHCKQEYMENSPTVQCIDGKWTDPVPPCEGKDP